VEDLGRLDIQRDTLPVNPRYSLLDCGDASFAVGETKQSVTGFIIYLNGVPLLWGSLKQTVVVDWLLVFGRVRGSQRDLQAFTSC
jgi:hypothetical protein